MHQLPEHSESIVVSHLHEGGLNLVDEVKEKKKKMETPPHLTFGVREGVALENEWETCFDCFEVMELAALK